MQHLINFIKSQRLLTLATADEGGPWISNVYYGFEDGVFFFISGIDTKHSQQIINSSSIAFSTAWYNPNDHTDRKSIQGAGICIKLEKEENIKSALEIYNRCTPKSALPLTVERVREDHNRAVWMIRPTQIKFWNDGLYGVNGTKTFDFS